MMKYGLKSWRLEADQMIYCTTYIIRNTLGIGVMLITHIKHNYA